MRPFARNRIRIFGIVAASAAVLMAFLPVCSAQSTTRDARPDPKANATAPELFEYVRSALLLLTPEDGVNDNQEVTMNWTTNVMTIAQPAGHCDLYMNALNANDVAWDVFDPSDAHETREKLVRLTLVSVSGTKARTCYDKAGRVDEGVPSNRIRFLFSYQKADQWPNFQSKLTKALKRLIVLSGGAGSTERF
jgi:hypothetical protein